MHDSPQHRAARNLAQRLAECGVDYAIVGAFAVAAHGHERFTADVDVLITAEGLAKFKREWLGRGYLEPVAGGRGIRDTAENVPIDFVIAGQFPGDGRQKPIAFPDPALEIAALAEGMRVIGLPRLLELKLASGMTAPHRLGDLADVIALIRANGLAREFGLILDPWVRAKFDELWQAAQGQDPE